jgi:(p)ppGpp synthase/HD superfamily hydrolase
VQIRTREMHRHAELGVAAHWRYKEGSKATPEDRYDEKIAWLRQLLTWRDEVADSSDWVRHYKQAAFDETVYILTPQGRVVDLPRGATPVDFAYRVHTDIGHRCRGAKVDGALVPLNTQLATGQRVEIVLAKHGGPSRDWLNPRSAICSPIARGQGQAVVRQPGARGHPGRGAGGGAARTAAAWGSRGSTSTTSPSGWALPAATTCSSPWRAPS